MQHLYRGTLADDGMQRFVDGTEATLAQLAQYDIFANPLPELEIGSRVQRDDALHGQWLAWVGRALWFREIRAKSTTRPV